MPRFAYTAIDTSGTLIEGISKADTIADARSSLLSQDLYPTKLAE
ncbi:MAG: type II secretion system F family protein, partial [Actinobacteria bacterium]|nr:type II secretion system F family protein [Actinomycetota bacterium]